MRCPYCDEPISEDVERCPHCAEFVRDSTREADGYQKTQTKTHRRGRGSWVLLGVVFVLLLGGSVAGAAVAYRQGRAAGYNSGERDGLVAGEEAGYQRGYEEGQTKGHETGYQEGYEAGEQDGYDAGVAQGYRRGSREGFTGGYTAGATGGYETGYRDGCLAVFTALSTDTVADWRDVDGLADPYFVNTLSRYDC